jgi:hypothetical protein
MILLFISGAIEIFSMAFINGAEWIIVILIIVILFFGARKIPELAKESKGRFGIQAAICPTTILG